MALSLAGRKLMAEVVGCVAVLIAGAYVLTHTQETKQFAAKLFGLKPAQEQAAATSASGIMKQEQAASSSRRRVELAAQGNGHHFAEAEINGRSITGLVDTGASMVALTYDDARRAGVLPRDSEFTQRASTANGVTKFAAIRIDRMSIGGIEVRNVSAAVMEDGKLETSLIGMSYLSKLGRVDLRSGRLVLEE